MSWEEAAVTHGIILVNDMTTSMQKIALTPFSVPTRDHWAESLIEEGQRMRITLQNTDTKQRTTISCTTFLKMDVTPYQIDDVDPFEHIAADQILVKTEPKSNTTMAGEQASSREPLTMGTTHAPQDPPKSGGEIAGDKSTSSTSEAQTLGGSEATALLQALVDEIAQLKTKVEHGGDWNETQILSCTGTCIETRRYVP